MVVTVVTPGVRSKKLSFCPAKAAGTVLEIAFQIPLLVCGVSLLLAGLDANVMLGHPSLPLATAVLSTCGSTLRPRERKMQRDCAGERK